MAAFYILMPLALLLLVVMIFHMQWINRRQDVSRGVKIFVSVVTAIVVVIVIFTMIVKVPEMLR